MCIIEDDRILINIARERFRRIKYVIQIRARDIDVALKDAGVSFSDIDFCAITTTQNYPYLFFRGDDLRIEYAVDPVSSIPLSGNLKENWSAKRENVMAPQDYVLKQYPRSINLDPTLKQKFGDDIDDIVGCLPTTESYIASRNWESVLRLDEIPKKLSPRFFSMLDSDDVRQGFHFPLY